LSNEEQDRASGSVPNAFGNALAWNWMPKMPASLKRSNLHTLLYTLRAIANADGTLRYRDTKRPFSLQAIAKAAGADQKDTRDRIEAAIRAGVVTVVGERRKGRSALYVIVPSPSPNWAAAAAYLDGVKTLREEARQKRKSERKPAPWSEEKGGRPPVLGTPEKEGPPPEVTDGTDLGERGTAPQPSTGDRPPNGSGDRPPYTPGGYPWGSHDGAEVSSQPQVDGAPGPQPIDPHEPQAAAEPPPDWIRCARCGDHMLPRYGRTTHAHCQPLPEPERTAS
jgi:hypothetical protein